MTNKRRTKAEIEAEFWAGHDKHKPMAAQFEADFEAIMGKPEQIERQELHCHECQRYVQFALDVSVNGNHVLHCPNCNHEHCRVVCDGKITDIRWAQRNGPTFQIVTVTSSTASAWTHAVPTTATGTTTTASTFAYSSWMNRYYS